MVWTAFLSLFVELTEHNPLCHCFCSLLDIKLQVTRRYDSLSIFLSNYRRIFLNIPPHIFHEIREVSGKSMAREKCFLLYLFDVFITWSTSWIFFLAKWANLTIPHQYFILLFIWGASLSWPFRSFSAWKLNIKLTQTGICRSHRCQVFSYTSTVLLTGIEILKIATCLIVKWELEL